MSNYSFINDWRRPLLPPAHNEDVHGQPLTFYPKSFFHLSPVYSSWARLTAQDIFKLQTRAGFEGQSIYFYLNHPIRWVRVMGIVVSFQRNEEDGKVVIHLDDGSGETIPLVYFHEDPSRPSFRAMSRPLNAENLNFRGIGLHSVVKVKGEISMYRNKRQLTMRRIELVENTNAEAEAWRIATEFKRDRLLKPWVISREEFQNEIRRQGGTKKAARHKVANWRVHQETEITVQESSKPKVFIGKRREKMPEAQEIQPGRKIKREREVSPELTLSSQKRVKHTVYTMEPRYRERIKGEKRRVPAAEGLSSKYARSRDNAATDGESKLLEEQIRSTRESSTRDDDCRLRPSSGTALHRSNDRHRAQTERIRSITTPSPPPSSPDPERHNQRSLKLVILKHIHTRPMPNFTITTLRSIPEIESYTRKVVKAQNQALPPSSIRPNAVTSNSALAFQTLCEVLETLVQDGNIFRIRKPSISQHAYVAVGRWNLGDLVEEEISSAKDQAIRKLEKGEQQRIKDKQEGMERFRRPVYGGRITGKISVRAIWLKAKAKGGGWEGVTKGVVADVVKEVVEEKGDWKDIGKGWWEWEVPDRLR